MKVYKIKKETVQYQDYLECFTWSNKWEECNDKIKELLGVESKGFIYYTINRLTMQKAPQHLAKDFCKPVTQGNHVVYKAKKNSQINKQWVEFCKDNKLPEPVTLNYLQFVYNLFSFSGDYGRYNLQKINDDLYLEITEGGTDWNKIEWVEQFSVPQFLRLKAELLENKVG